MENLNPIINTIDPFCPFELPQLFKVYNDGGHFVATRVVKNSFPRSVFFDNKKNLYNNFFNEYYSTQLNKIQIESLFAENFKNLSKSYIKEIVDSNIKRVKSNTYARIKRFKRKAFLNNWSHFVTITYDSAKHDEISFRKKLRKVFSNFHTRRGWTYMGVFERSPLTVRLHFHALINIPEGQMVGTLSEVKDYSFSTHKMQITHSNSFFAKKFGRNDFKAVCKAEISNGFIFDYMLKYLVKSGEKIIYSRGIPSEIEMRLFQDDLLCSYTDFVEKFVVCDSVFSDIEKQTLLKQQENATNLSIFDSDYLQAIF